MTWSVNNLFGLEIGKDLQKYRPTHGKPGVDLFFFFFGGQHGKILLVDMMASKKKKKKRGQHLVFHGLDCTFANFFRSYSKFFSALEMKDGWQP